MSENNEANEIDLSTLKPEIEIKSHHQWVQKGPMLICTSCPLKHSAHIGMHRRLIGVVDGLPQFETIQ